LNDSKEYIKQIYDNLKEDGCYGKYRKTVFHIHTPASYDFRLLNEWGSEEYEKKTCNELIEICQDCGFIPRSTDFTSIDMSSASFSVFDSEKDFLSYFLIAGKLSACNYEIAVVTDHNTIDGIEKLRCAIDIYYNQFCKNDVSMKYTNIVSGVEISCADKLHVVVIFENNKKRLIEDWISENVMSSRDGSFCTSLNVIEHFESIGCFAYIAHINSADLFKEERAFSGAYKRKLKEAGCLEYIGVSEKNKIETINKRLHDNKIASAKFFIDNDSHNIEGLGKNYFYVKTGKLSSPYKSLIEAIRDYEVSISLKERSTPHKYIVGIYVEPENEGFLIGKKTDVFELRLSSALNCFIGGRGTGKSTIIQLLNYALAQEAKDKYQLEYLCSHGNIWILFCDGGTDYLIKAELPKKEHEWEDILSYFGKKGRGQYANRDLSNAFDESELRNYILRNYLHIYRIDTDGISHVSNNRLFMKSVFDSVNSLNNIASMADNNSISEYIYRLLFADKDLESSNFTNAKSLSGLVSSINQAETIQKKREDNVHRIIDPFNEKERGVLMISYSQTGSEPEPDIEKWMMIDSSDRSDYAGYPIEKKSVIDYVLNVYYHESFFEFFKIAANASTEKRYKYPIDEFLRKNANLSDDEKKDIVDRIYEDLINKDNARDLIEYINSAVAKMEVFQLLFNINSKSSSEGPAKYRDVCKLSQGQKVVALLDFVIGYGTYIGDSRPLVIDQPEDNLDNQYIYHNLVKQLRTIKDERQVIIATHNATIVTNSMTDLVCVMESDGNHGWVKQEGYPSEVKIKKNIVNYLEGGADSFRHKMEVYKPVIRG